MTNDAGGVAYSRTPVEDAVKMLMVGSTANLFYTDSETNIDRAIAAFSDEKVPVEFLAKAIIYARNEGFNRELPIMGLAVLSKRDVNMYKTISGEVLKTPHDWEMFIDICKSGKIREGVGRSIKTDMKNYLSVMPAYQVLKYPTAVYDMVNISRPDPKNALSAYYVKNGGNWTKYMDTLYIELDETQKEYLEPFYAYENAKICVSNKDYESAAKLIRDYRLPYECVTSIIGKNPECWKALYDVAPYFNMIRNLNNFIKYGVITNHNVKSVANKIMDDNAVVKSKMYPFRFYQAWKNLNNDEGELSVASFNVIKYALEMAIEMSLKNVPDIQGVTVVATDCSGSMSSPVNSEMTDVSCIEIAGIFSAILKLKNPNSIMLPFDSNIRMDTIKSIGIGKSVTEIANKFVACGGTAISAPYAFLIDNKIRIDNFIGITDNMEWIPSSYTTSLYGNNTSSGMFVDALQKYKKTINPNVKSYLITLQGYRGAPVPPEMKDVHTIYGWNDQVLKYIGTRFDEQVKTISEMSI